MIGIRHLRKRRVLPAVHCLGAFGRELDHPGFAGCGSEVAVFVTKAPNDGAVPVVVVEVEFLSFEHWLAASDAGCAVCLGE